MRIIIVLIILAGAGWYFFGDKAEGPGAIISSAPRAAAQKLSMPPIQKNLAGNQTVKFGYGTLYLLASYEVTARILSRKDYTIGKESTLAPVDLALGWGRMAQPSVLSKLRITQDNRFYHYYWSNGPPISPQEIITSSANTHIIPANKAVEKSIRQLKKNQIVTLKGFLVRYHESKNKSWWEWKSSLTRADSGAGACEVFYVEHVIAY